MRIYVVLQYIVISRNVISNEAVGNISKILYMHRIHTIQLKLITYHIKVSKFQTICFYVTKEIYTNIKIFDGPSVESKVIATRMGKTCGATFQIITQISEKIVLQYKGENLSQIQNQFVGVNILNFEIPGFLCDIIRICGIKFEALPGMYVNFTVVNFLFKGHKTSDCKFGGAAFYDKQTHFLDLCNGYGPSRPARNIYSTSSTLLVMIYTYLQESSLTIKVNVSTTSCKPVTLERCEYERNCGNLNKCHQWLKEKPQLKFFELTYLELLTGYKTKVDSCFILQIASDIFKNNTIHASKKTILSQFTTTCFLPLTPRFVEESKRVIHYTAFGFTSGRVVRFLYCKEPSAFLEKNSSKQSE